MKMNVNLKFSVPTPFNQPGKCRLCGRKMPFLSSVLKSGELKHIHEECYAELTEKRKQAFFEYRKAWKAAITDGSISVDANLALEDLSHKLQLSESEVKQLRLLVYHDLFSEATADRSLTEKEEDLLKQVQNELQLSDAEIQRHLSQLARLRLFRQFSQGELPVIAPDILVAKREVAHWQCDAEFWEERVTARRYVGASHGVSVRIVKGVYYRVGSQRGELVTDRDITKVDQGRLVITNKRIVFNGFTKSFSIPFSKLINYVVYQDAIQLDKEGKTKPGYFKVQDPEVIAALRSAIAQKS